MPGWGRRHPAIARSVVVDTRTSCQEWAACLNGLTMKLAILSRAPRAYSTQRLRIAALDRGHNVKVLNTLRFAIDLSGDEPDLHAVRAQAPTVEVDQRGRREQASG